MRGERWVSAYLPVWLYSYYEKKPNGKSFLHYVAVNARTGETMGSVPLNQRKLLLVSAAVPRAPFVWALLLPVAAVVLERAGLAPRIALRTSQPLDPTLLQALPGVGTVEVDGSSARFAAERPAAVLAPLARELESRGIELLDLTVRQATLEDAYLALTGAAAPPAPPAPPEPAAASA